MWSKPNLKIFLSFEDIFVLVKLPGRGNNVATPYDDRGERITSTQKVGNFFKMLGTFPNKKLV
jgi:hypothetical protein